MAVLSDCPKERVPQKAPETTFYKGSRQVARTTCPVSDGGVGLCRGKAKGEDAKQEGAKGGTVCRVEVSCIPKH
jgi:hypothetical protein